MSNDIAKYRVCGVLLAPGLSESDDNEEGVEESLKFKSRIFQAGHTCTSSR